MYRPTVRYDDIYREYIDELFQATSLDRNQIIRLALFSAAHNDHFQDILSQNTKKDVPLPSPSWSLANHRLWREQCSKQKGEERDVSAQFSRRTEVASVARSDTRPRAIGITARRKDVSGSREGRPRQIRIKDASKGIEIKFD